MRALTEMSACTYESVYLVLTEMNTSYSFGLVRCTCFGGMDCCGRAVSPLGRYSCIAQGASPGLIIGIYLLSPNGAALPAQVLGVGVLCRYLRA